MADTTLNFTDGNSGKITKTGFGTYTPATGYANCQIVKNDLTGTYARAYFNFDTSGLGSGVTITKVEFRRVDSLAQPAPPNHTTNAEMYMGQIVNGSLDGNIGEWDGGTILNIDIIASYSDGDWIDLNDGGVDPTSLVDVNGETDIKIVDITSGIGNTSHNFNQIKIKCQLRITYTENAVVKDVILTNGIIPFPR